MTRELFTLKNVSFSVADHRILDRLNMVLYEGETAFVVGTPDCGKMQLAKLLAGQEKPEHGNIFYQGNRILSDDMKRAKKMGIYLVQNDTPFLSNLSIAENIALSNPPIRMHAFYKKQTLAVLQIICEEYGIPLKLEKKADRLSPSDILFIHLSRAILLKTRALILQDLLYLLRESEVEQVFRTVALMKENGISAIFLESTPQYALHYSDRCLFMCRGMVIADKRRGEWAEEEAARLVATQVRAGLSDVDSIPAKQVKREEERVIAFLTPQGPKNLKVYSGRCTGVTCEHSDQLLWFLEKSFTRACMKDLNDKKAVSVISLNDLQKDCFYFMKFEDNLILPILNRISTGGMLNQKRHLSFLNNEFSEASFAGKNIWKRDLYSLSETDRKASVLYRVLIEGTDIIVMTGHLEQLTSGLLEEVRLVIRTALSFHKSVVVYAKNCEILKELSDEIRYLDVPENN